MSTLTDWLEKTNDISAPDVALRSTPVEAPEDTILPPVTAKREPYKPSPLADWLANDDETQRLNLSIEEGMAKDPGRSTRILQMQTRTGLPKDFIDSNLDWVEQQAARQDFNPDLFKRRSRSLAAWISEHPDHAAAVKEDLSKLSYLERQYRYISGQYERGKLTTELSDLGLRAMEGTITPAERSRADLIQKALSETDNSDITGFFEQIPGQVANQIPIQLRSITGKVQHGAEGAVLGAAAGAAAGAATANPVLPAAGAVLGAATGWRYGAAVEAGKMEASLAFLDYQTLKDEQGQPLDRTTVLGLAGIVGVVNGALEGLTGIERAVDKLPGVRNLTKSGLKQLLDSPSARQAVLAYAKTVGAVMAEEGITEGIQSLVTNAGKVLAKATGGPTDILGEIFSSENLAQAIQEARAAAQGGGGMGAVIAAPTLATDLRAAKQAKQAEQTFLAIGEATGQTKIKDTLPDRLQALVKDITKDGPIETVYIPTEAFNTYFQSKGVDPREVAAAITGNVEAYDQAVQTGQDLPIRTADYATKIAPTEHNAFFAKELRTAVDAMNAREAEEWAQRMEEQESAAVQQVGLETAPVTDSAAKVRQDIAGMLQSAGFEATVADYYARLYEGRARARAERRGLGEDPFELFQKLNLTVTKQIPEILKTLGKQQTELDVLLNRLRVGDLSKPQEIFGQSLTEFLKDKGGLQDQGGELAARDIDRARKPFEKKLVQEKGLTLDQAAELATEAGYLQERDLGALLDALDQETRGTPVYAIGKENVRLLDVQHNLDALQHFLADREIDLKTTTNEQIKVLLGEAVQQPLPAVEGQTFAQEGGNRLSALHNLSADNLLYADKLGGLPVPSIAVVPAHLGVRGMGEITLIGSQDLADPSQVPVHDADVYSPTFPRPSYPKVATKKAQAFVDTIKPIGATYDRTLVDRTWDGLVNTPDPEGVIQTWLNSSGAKAMYLAKTETVPDPIMRPVTVPAPWAAFLDKEQFRAILPSNDERPMEVREQALHLVKPLISQAVDRYLDQTQDGRAQLELAEGDRAEARQMAVQVWNIPGDWLDSDEPMPYAMEWKITESLNRLGEVEIDDSANREYLDDRLRGREADFTSWVQDTITTQFGEPYLKINGKKQPFTLENIVQVMTGAIRAQEQTMTFGEGKARAAAARAFSDLEEMRDYAENIQSEESISAARERAKEAMNTYREKVVKHYGQRADGSAEFGRVWEGLDASMKAMARWARGGKTVENMRKSLRAAGFNTARMADSVLEQAVEAGKLFLAAPVPYFEAKPQRAVALEEFAGAVIPTTTIQPVRDVLTKHGIPFREYDSSAGPKAQQEATIQFRAELAKTQPKLLFQTGGKKGAITFGDNLINIKLLEQADLSTFLHETGHLYLNELIDDATTEGTPQQLRDDLDAVLKWMGLEVTSASGRDAIKAAVQTPQHEQFARGFEAYALEGKAPSQALREAFARFRQWLVQVYRLFRQGVDAAGKALDVTLTKEVREVMDRMLATDEEIDAAAQEAEVLPLFTDAAQAGMTEAQWKNYQETVGKASRTAREQLQAKLMAQLTRQKETWWKAAREKMVAAVTAEVNQQPEYIALAVLQTGKLPDGSDLPEGIQATRLDRKGIADVFGKDFLKRLPRKTTTTKEGLHFETAAQIFGYASGQEFIMALVNARPKQQLIDDETDRRMTEEYGDMRLDGTMAEAARTAVLNEHQDAVIAAEIKALNQKRREVAPFVKTAVKEAQAAHAAELEGIEAQQTAEARARRFNEQAGKATFWAFVPSLEAVRETARQQVARTPVRRLQPYAYFIAGQKASRAAVKALADKDYMAAGVAKHKELLNLALFREASAAVEEADQIAEHMRRLTKQPAQERLGKAGADYLDQVNALLERFEFTRVPNRQLDRRASLAEWITAKETAGETLGEEFNVPESLLNEARRVNYRELTYEELVGLRDTVKQIEHFAALKNKLLKAQKARDKELAREALITAIEKNLEDKGPPPLTKAGLTTGEKVTKLAQQFDASLIKMEQLIEWLDGGPTGPWHDYFWNPAADAQAAEYDATKTITAKIAAAVTNIPAAIRQRMLETVKIAGIENVVTRKDLLGVALNVGNQGNYDKLLKGMGWTAEQVQAMTEQLTAEEWRFVQGIWDTLESLWPEIAALQKRITGLEPEKVDARPITNQHGTFRGGYYPIMYSAVLSDQGQLQLASNIGGLLEDSYTRATIPSGHRKARVEGFARPFDLDLDRLPNHIAGVVKDLTHREWLMDANWIANDPEIRAVLQRHLGDALTTRLGEWVKQVVNDRNSNSLASLGIWKRAVEHLRYNSMIVSMGFKASTLLSQLAGVAPAIEVIGGKDHDGAQWFAKGVGEVLRRPQSSYDFMTAKSGEMRHRLQTRDRDLRDNLRRLEGRTDLRAQIQEVSMLAIGYAELMVSMPSWFGAYYKALAQGMDDETAVRMGDRAVRLGQGAGGAKDLASVAARNESLLRLMTMFYTPFSALYGRLRAIGHDVGGLGDVPGAAFRLFWVVLVAATLGELASGHGPDDEKDEDWLAWWLKAVGSYPFLSVPLLRDVANAITSEYGYQFSPITQALKSPVTAAQSAVKVWEGDKEFSDFAEKALKAMSYLVGLPTGQLTITGTYLYDLYTGTAHPDNIFEFAKGMLYRRTKEERGQ